MNLYFLLKLLDLLCNFNVKIIIKRKKDWVTGIVYFSSSPKYPDFVHNIKEIFYGLFYFEHLNQILLMQGARVSMTCVSHHRLLFAQITTSGNITITCIISSISILFL